MKHRAARISKDRIHAFTNERFQQNASAAHLLWNAPVASGNGAAMFNGCKWHKFSLKCESRHLLMTAFLLISNFSGRHPLTPIMEMTTTTRTDRTRDTP